MTIRAVLFDWRGTLVTTLDGPEWIRRSLLAVGRPADGPAVERVAEAIAAAGGDERLDAPGVDSDAHLHRRTYLGVFADAGLDDDLARALYAVESDLRHNPFASSGLAPYVDVWTLSFEQGVQKPDPAVFTRTLQALGVTADEALVVGDRSGPDGAAVEQGVLTLLLPPLRDVGERRLHRVLALVDAG